MPRGINYLIATGGGYRPPDFDYAQARHGVEALKGQELRNALRERVLKREPERFEMEKEEFEWQKQLMDWQQEDRPIQKELKALAWLKAEAPMINWGNYPESRDYLIKQGINPELLPDPQQMLQEALNVGVEPVSYFEQWKNQAMMNMDQRVELMKAQIVQEGKKAPKPRQLGTTRTIQKGTEAVTEQWMGTGWEEIGRGPKFKPGTEKESPKEKQKRKRLDDLSQRFFQQIGRYYSAKRGVGQFIQDPNKEAVANEALESAKLIAQQYVEAGGDPRDLGLDSIGQPTRTTTGTSSYKTAEEVKAAYKAGTLTKDEATQILRQQFGFE
jgi:hypothetical protein